MPRQKNVSQQEVDELMEAIEYCAGRAVGLIRRMENGYCDEMPKAFEHGWLAISQSRHLLEFGSMMLHKHQAFLITLNTEQRMRELTAAKQG